MSVDFQEIPECVFELFCDIMYADPDNRGRTSVCSNKGAALILAWGWNPPLMKHGSEQQLTQYGLAAYAWWRLRAGEAVWLGHGVVRIGKQAFALEFQEATVLQALVELGGAARRPDLEARASVKDVAEIMKKLNKRFPNHVTLPGKKGRGGYSTTIKDGTKAES